VIGLPFGLGKQGLPIGVSVIARPGRDAAADGCRRVAGAVLAASGGLAPYFATDGTMIPGKNR